MDKGGQDYPGFLIFFVLWVLSFIYFLFFADDQYFTGVGFFLILWSLMVMARIHWLSSTFFPMRKSFIRLKFLPQKLLNEVQTHRAKRRGLLALKTVNPVFGVFLVFAFFYCSMALWSYLSGSPDPQISLLDQKIEDFFVQQNQLAPDLNFFNWKSVVRDFAIVLIILFALWVSQTYAYSKANVDRLLWFGGLMFIIAFLKLVSETVNAPGSLSFDIPYHVFGSGWGMLDFKQHYDPILYSPLSARIVEAGLFASIFLYMACCVLLCVFSYYARKAGSQKSYARGGLLVLFALLCCDVFLINSSSIVAIWLVLFAALGALWMRSSKSGTKMYIMRQL